MNRVFEYKDLGCGMVLTGLHGIVLTIEQDRGNAQG